MWALCQIWQYLDGIACVCIPKYHIFYVLELFDLILWEYNYIMFVISRFICTCALSNALLTKKFKPDIKTKMGEESHSLTNLRFQACLWNKNIYIFTEIEVFFPNSQGQISFLPTCLLSLHFKINTSFQIQSYLKLTWTSCWAKKDLEIAYLAICTCKDIPASKACFIFGADSKCLAS